MQPFRKLSEQVRIGELEPLSVNFWTHSIQDALKKASGALITGLVLRILDYQIGWPLLAQGVGLLATRLVVNLSSVYTGEPFYVIDALSVRATELVARYPNMRLIGFLFALALSWSALGISLLLGLSLGTLGALTINREQIRPAQEPSEVPG